ncbi:DUF2398 family protein [Streptomyces sp. NPDC060366]|uniref:DUF2398 family protein n=1 Tax=Streptomyces sp. NPDC060366 TaxID=3347105 RepID=UPI00364ADED1
MTQSLVLLAEAARDEAGHSEVAELARRLGVRTWLVGGRDDHLIEAVHRNAGALREVYGAVGWSLAVEPDLVRVHKPGTAAGVPVDEGPAPKGVWFWLTAAALESLPERVGLGQVVAAARAAAAEAEVKVTQSGPERAALVGALAMLRVRGLLEEIEGRVEAFLEEEDPPVLLRVHHGRLLHLQPRDVALDEYGQWETDPGKDPQGWLATLHRPADPMVRVCGMLVDQAAVHACDLADEERQWFSDRLADEGCVVAEAFGLRVEHRVEGAAFVVPQGAYSSESELGPFVFPHRHRNRGGTVRHAALLLVDHLVGEGERGGAMAPGPGWCGARAAEVVDRLGGLAVRHVRWAQEYRDRPERLAHDVRDLLEPSGLLRVVGGYDDWWWVSPAAARWTVVADDVSVRGAEEEQ